MDIFKKIFGGRGEPERSTIRFDDLDSWLEEKESNLNSKVLAGSRPLYIEATATLREARRLVEKIHGSEPPSQVPRAVRGQVEKACRRFGKGALTIIEDITTDSPNTFKEIESFHRDLVEALSKIRGLSQIHGRLISASSPNIFRALMGRLRKLSSQGERLEGHLSSIRWEYEALKEIRDTKADVEERIRHLIELKTGLIESERLAEEALKASEEIRVQLGEIEDSEGYLRLLDERREMEDLEAKLEKWEKRIYGVLGPMARTLRKFRKYVHEDEYALNRETLKALDGYISQPLEAFLVEEEGHPFLTNIALGVKTLIERGTLDVKTRRKERILQHLERILGGKLISIQREYNHTKDEVASMRKKFDSSPLLHQMENLREDLEERMESISRLEEKKKAELDHESILEQELSRLKRKIEEDMAKVEGRSIEVKMETP